MFAGEIVLVSKGLRIFGRFVKASCFCWYLRAFAPTSSAGPLRAARPSLRSRYRGGSPPSNNYQVSYSLKRHKLPLGNFEGSMNRGERITKVTFGQLRVLA